MKDKKNYKVKPLVFIIAGAAILAIIAVIIAVNVISANNKNKENTVGMTLTQKNLRPQDAEAGNSEPKEITTVEILMDDTAIPVGTTFMAAAIVEPADTDKALVWTSSNEDVMTVSEDGLVAVKGTGTAALTATVGDVSDAVAIEGIENAAAGSKNGYTVYTGNGSILKSSSSASAGSSSGSGNGSSYSDNSSYAYNSTGSNSGYSSGTGSNHGNSSSIGNNSSGSASNNTNSGDNGGSSYNPGNNSSDNPSDTDNNGNNQGNSSGSDGKTSNDIGDVLDGQGFTQEYSNVYVYTENGTYYGEIITQPNVSIIYIKQRNDGFDARVKGVLAQLLPESYNQVWNNYVSATTDRTFTVEDRKVRIVTASRGGHSQIVIYN